MDDVLQQLDTLQEQYWSRWKEEADMMDQGASVAYEHSYWFESVEIAEYEYMICASQLEPFWIEVKQAINILQGK